MLKDAYEKEVADIKEKRNKVWCHLAQTLDATAPMLMRRHCVGDDGIEDGTKAWKRLQESFQSVETSTVVTLVAQLLGDAEDLDSFFIRGQELLTRLQEVGEAVSETLFNAVVLNGLPMRYKSFVVPESFNPATNLTELRKRLHNFHGSTAQRRKRQNGSVALAVKRDFKKGPKMGNCFECEIPGHLAKDCRRKETVQCRKCGQKGHHTCCIDRACKRQRDGGRHESVAIGPTLASPDEEYWAALTQWSMLVDSGCTEHIVTNIDAFLDLVLIQSVVRNRNGEAFRVVDRGCVKISIPSSKGEFQCELKNVLCVPDYSSNLIAVSRCTEWGHSFTFEKRNSCMKLQKETRVKLTQENNMFYLPCSVLEFKVSSNSVKFDSARKWHRRLGHLNQVDLVRTAPETVGELDDVCNVCALAKITKTPVPIVVETQKEEKLERVFTDMM